MIFQENFEGPKIVNFNKHEVKI